MQAPFFLAGVCPCFGGAGCSLVVAGDTAAAADGQAWCHGTGTLETVLRLHAQAGAMHFSYCWLPLGVIFGSMSPLGFLNFN